MSSHLLASYGPGSEDVPAIRVAGVGLEGEGRCRPRWLPLEQSGLLELAPGTFQGGVASRLLGGAEWLEAGPVG